MENTAKKIANKTSTKEYYKEYYKNNREKITEYNRNYWLSNRAELAESKKKYNADNKKHLAKMEMLRQYNLSTEKYKEMYAAQGGKCKICMVMLPVRAAIDHDHNCCSGAASCGKCVRGLLCRRCNTGLGQFKDSIRLLEAAVIYLQENRIDNHQ
jgi:hypothetical protein